MLTEHRKKLLTASWATMRNALPLKAGTGGSRSSAVPFIQVANKEEVRKHKPARGWRLSPRP